ncbi:unnamed protein product [Ilex paraguariensis]|uniref:Uncharacterized protein n=1 Tax=Ilex paraguariensis TaxID=185542 RepID=A0ABC8SC10_9AQUA
MISWHFLVDHTHFKIVIERLQEIAAEEKHNSNLDDSVDLADEDPAETATPETNEEVTKYEQTEEGEIEIMETDVPEVHSPVKSDNSEDDCYRWSQYKSEL